MRRAAWFALAAALCFAAPASAQQADEDDGQRSCYTSLSAEECAKKHFKQRTELDVDDWRPRFEGANWKQDDDCQAVKTALFDLFDKTESAVSGKTARIYFALPKDNDTYWLGSYWEHMSDSTEHLVVVNDTISREEKWKSLLHEAAHHAGYPKDHSGNWPDAEGCAEESNEEDPNGGGGNEDDPDPEDETCTTTTVWEVRWRPCHSWSGGSLPDLTVCFEKIRVPVQVTICD